MCVNCSLIRRKATASGNPKDKMKPVIMAVFKMRILYVIFICNQQGDVLLSPEKKSRKAFANLDFLL